jgi:hypothetical protein
VPFTLRRFFGYRASCGLSLITLATFLVWPVKASSDLPAATAAVAAAPLVCACCTDEGEWYQTTGKVDLFQLGRIRLAAKANTHQPPSSNGELASNYNLSHTRNGRRWQLSFRDEQGKTGTISFVLPLNAVHFGADLHDAEPGGLGPLLYKEWRFNGTAQVTGIFKSLMRGPVRFHLILQGRGRGCTEAEDFKHWTLQISVAGNSHTFYGPLNDPQ